MPTIISSYANQNFVTTGGASLIPGSLGMAAAIPKIAMVSHNQLKMIYDIGMAHGKEKVLTQELLAGVFAHTLGASVLGLLTMHGSKVVVRKASLKVLQKIIQLLEGKVSQRLLKSMVSKWLPVIGAAVMAAWSNYTTREIGKKAVEIFEKNIKYVSETIGDDSVDAFKQSSFQEVEEVSSAKNPDPTKHLDFLKIQSFINLMIDG